MAESDLTGADGTDTIMDPPHLPPAAAPDATPTVFGAPQHFCPNCHSPVAAEAAFCPSCGEALAANPFVSTPATANQSSGVAPSPISMTRPATSSVSASASRATQTGVRRPAAKSGVSAGDVIELIVDLIGGAWSLIVSAAVVIVVVVAGIAFIKSHFGAGLSEHSTCQQFEQADASAQDKVLQDM
ncbi:MAG TPA: zinc ribbon domain-containing protein, partial [Ktedonobacterales bacterium]|nr:zinc ribbon domain-containing protein [Ktedonobacterales bacterium]